MSHEGYSARGERWEHGSDFHFPREVCDEPERPPPWSSGRFFGSGRDALRALVAWGRAKGWGRVFFPSFYCHDVAHALRADGVDVVAYPDAPDGEAPRVADVPAAPGDVILVANQFAFRKRARAQDAPRGAIVVEDHTHDPLSPWALASDAPYAIASLRKTLPLPDGGALWSPRGEALPDEPAVSAELRAASFDRLGAMLLKARYLEGAPITKDAFRALAIAGEEAIARGPVSAMTAFSRALLTTFPIAAWHRARAGNFETLARALALPAGVRLLRPVDGAPPFAAILAFDDAAACAACRSALIAERIYPAVLWPLDAPAGDVPRDHAELATRLLTIHCDQRYRGADMLEVGAAVERAVEAR